MRSKEVRIPAQDSYLVKERKSFLRGLPPIQFLLARMVYVHASQERMYGTGKTPTSSSNTNKNLYGTCPMISKRISPRQYN